MKKILLIATGGTLASSKTIKGLVPSINVQTILNYLPKITLKNCKIETFSLFCIDSSDMNSNSVLQIAHTIYDNYHHYDSFIIIHGTDTMAYTSALLSYMFENLNKPIILTGSQIPIEQRKNDAIKNLSDSIFFAKENFGGVVVIFDGKVICGLQAYKKRSQSFNAFESINEKIIATIKNKKIYYNLRKLPKYDKSLIFKNKLEGKVYLMKLFPNISSSIFEKIATENRAMVIEGFGVGNIPTTIKNSIRKIINNTIIVVTTQCMLEGVVAKKYTSGNISDKVIYLGATHSESIIAKCQVALGYYRKEEDSIKFIKS